MIARRDWTDGKLRHQNSKYDCPNAILNVNIIKPQDTRTCVTPKEKQDHVGSSVKIEQNRFENTAGEAHMYKKYNSLLCKEALCCRALGTEQRRPLR